MVQEYTERFYIPAHEQWYKLNDMSQALAKDLAQWKNTMYRLLPQVRIDETRAETEGEITVGMMIPVQTKVFVGDIMPDDISVNVYFGVLDSRGNIVGGEMVPIETFQKLDQGLYLFTGEIESRFSGRHGFLIRVMPKHSRLGAVYEPGLILWG